MSEANRVLVTMARRIHELRMEGSWEYI